MAPEAVTEPILSKSLQLDKIRKALPAHVFQKSVVRSISFMLYDYSMWLGSTALMYALRTSFVWDTLPTYVQWLATGLFWAFSGFFMWGIFVVGHDCGHGTFSDYWLLNDILGHIMHGSIMVPFYPWALSHARHHMFHNHETKDYSHPWYTEERYMRPDEGTARFFREHKLLRGTFPLYGWFLYLYGMPDGSHFFPFSGQRMWKESDSTDQYKCIISSIWTIICGVSIYRFFGGDWNAIAYYYVVPLFVFGWWLVTVTYLQHHSPTTAVYNDSNWKFVDAAFETIDRVYGYGVDTLSHHITDGHVVHHLFFRNIPHYHLAEATAALQDYMVSNDLGKFYRQERTYDFFLRVFEYFYSVGFSCGHCTGDAHAPAAVPAGGKQKKN
jgi:omega-3 fatty acid desaturase (delta-15 desaturase)